MDVVIPHSLGLWGPQGLVSTPKRLNDVCRYWGWRKICGHYSETNIPQEPGSVWLWAKGTTRGPAPLRVKRGRECIMRFLHIMSPTKWSSIEEACSRTAHDLEQTEKQTDQGNRELTLKWLLV